MVVFPRLYSTLLAQGRVTSSEIATILHALLCIAAVKATVPLILINQIYLEMKTHKFVFEVPS